MVVYLCIFAGFILLGIIMALLTSLKTKQRKKHHFRDSSYDKRSSAVKTADETDMQYAGSDTKYHASQNFR